MNDLSSVSSLLYPRFLFTKLEYQLTNKDTPEHAREPR
jgi:hypothetical protein